TTDRPIDADIAIATADLNLGRPGDSYNRLAPYLPDVAAHPEANTNLITTAAQALLASDRVDDADALLRPWAKAAAAGRETWLHLASNGFPDKPASAAKANGPKAVDWINRVRPLIPAGDDRETHL